VIDATLTNEPINWQCEMHVDDSLCITKKRNFTAVSLEPHLVQGHDERLPSRPMKHSIHHTITEDDTTRVIVT
jgi:hypothetical protein